MGLTAGHSDLGACGIYPYLFLVSLNPPDRNISINEKFANQRGIFGKPQHKGFSVLIEA